MSDIDYDMVSIDQSLSSSGITFWQGNLPCHFATIPTDNSLEDIERLNIIFDTIEEILERNPDRVVLEGLSFGSISNSVRILGAIYYMIQLQCFKTGIPVYTITPTSLKKFATGKGKASKKDMWSVLPKDVMEEISTSFPTIKSGKYDVADSYFLGKYYLEILKED